MHVYNTTGAVSVARKAATAVLRGPQDHVSEANAELQRRRDAIFEALPEQRLVRPAGGWSLLVEVDDPRRRLGRRCSRRAWRRRR